jgi:nitroimidazol reductase NimA-like FMN-containing flavoprotein (pyridoxamine 5'-phosphate oxidase superfamily)
MSATPLDIPQWEVLDLLQGETIGRLCVVDQGYPLAFPINYRIVGGGDDLKMVFRTAPHAALARHRGSASLEVDRIDDRQAWSVIVRGQLRPVIGQHELPDTFPLVSEGRHRWMILQVGAMSGRRFRSTPTATTFAVEWQPETVTYEA